MDGLPNHGLGPAERDPDSDLIERLARLRLRMLVEGRSSAVKVIDRAIDRSTRRRAGPPA